MESRGLYTVGTKPPVIPKGLKTPLGTIQENYLEAKKQLDVVNDLAKVMVSQQVSSLAFQLTLNVRNKALSAYKDIMNMPV